MSRKKEDLAKRMIINNLFIILNRGEGYKANIKKLEAAGIKRQVIDSWLNGNRNPEMTSLEKVSNILEFDLDTFLSEDLDMTPEVKEITELLKRNKDPKVLHSIKILAEVGARGNDDKNDHPEN